jgi:ectoine hydroxylase-related dioxygenase (phytanoyl-CoA dioxygenase family)
MSAFHRDGFLAGIRVLDEDQVDLLRSELELLLDPRHPGAHLFHERHSNESREPGRVLFHALGAWRISPAFHDLLWNPAILIPASQILEGPVRFWHDQLFVKPPLRGGVVSWHQDYSYWTRTEPMAHLTCWIPLDDVDEENGCPQYVPGSHRWRLLPITGLTGDMDAIREVLTHAELREFRPRPALLRRGEATFHHPLTVHGSFQNRSTRPRRGIALNFCRDGTRSASDEPLLEGVPPIPRGRPLEGRFFPLLGPSVRMSAS